jgi:hypothetical protein
VRALNECITNVVIIIYFNINFIINFIIVGTFDYTNMLFLTCEYANLSIGVVVLTMGTMVVFTRGVGSFPHSVGFDGFLPGSFIQ